jgi:hypothetical protein
VTEGLNMRPVHTMPGLRVPRALIEANDGGLEPARDFAESLADVRLAFAELNAELELIAARSDAPA